jgi:hypothetical protein
MREEEMAKTVVRWLKMKEWEVYQEVSLYGKCCDIVAVKGDTIWAIECKVNLGVHVLEQAYHWKSLAHLISVAVLRPKKRRSAFLSMVMKDYGIGCLDVGPSYINRCMDSLLKYAVKETQGEKNTSIRPGLKRVLREEHKTWAAAGNANGKRFTPFQATAEKVKDLVKARSPISMSEMLEDLDHHYSSKASARQSLRNLIESGVIDGVRLRKEGKSLILEAC